MKNERPELEVKLEYNRGFIWRYALKYNHGRGGSYWVHTGIYNEHDLRKAVSKGQVTREQLEKLYVEKGHKDAGSLTNGQLIDMIFE